MSYHLTCCLSLDLHVCYFEFQCLVFDDRFAKLYTLFAICDSLIDAALCNTGCHTAHPCTSLIQCLHCDIETSAFLTDQIGSRDSDILQHYITGIGCTDTHLVLFFSCAQSRSSFFYEEHRHSFDTFCLICHGCYTVERSDTAVCDKAFSSVQYILITIFDCGCLACACIGTGTRLSQTECTESTVQDQITCTLL